ncbi:MAG: DUF308 domain-containing protein [Phycisphaerales bacterium]|nr:DUF308 domain-containing protein [Phycisphaerales bacterium]
MNDQMSNRILDAQQVIRQHRWVFLAEGVLLLLAGLFAISLPVIASGVLVLGLGIMTLVLGVVLFIRSLVAGSDGDRVSTLVTGVLFCIIAVVLLFWPQAGLEGITLLLGSFCILRGIMDVSGKPSRNHMHGGLQVISGIAGILLGGFLLAYFPSDAPWAIGLIFGVQLLFMGIGVLTIWNALDRPVVRGPVAVGS